MALNHHAHEQEHPLTHLIYTSLPTLTDGVTGTQYTMQDAGEIVYFDASITGPPSGDMTISFYINGNDGGDIVISSGTTFQKFQLPRRVHYSVADILTYSASGTAGASGSYTITAHVNRLG